MADFDFDMGDIDVPDAPDLTPPDPGTGDPSLTTTSWTTANDNQDTPAPAVTATIAATQPAFAQAFHRERQHDGSKDQSTPEPFAPTEPLAQ